MTDNQPKNPPLLPLLPTFWLLFHLDGAGVEWIDAGLPPPSYLEHDHGGYLLGYLLSGFFTTKRGQDYLNDTIGRFLVTFKDHRPRRLEFKPHVKPDKGHYYPKIYKLREVARHLDSLPSRGKAPRRADSYDDFAFWAIKFWVEDEIRATGGPVVYERLEAWALSQFVHKERSTIRAKCRSVWNWYNDREWEIRGSKMSRSENAKRVSKERKEESRRKVLGLVTGMFAEEYRRGEKWNLSKIGRDAGLSRETVRKIIREWEAEKEEGNRKEG